MYTPYCVVMTDGQERLDIPFFGQLRSVVQPVDILTLLAVPAVLVAVFSLPVETREALAFSYSEPTLLTAFTANYVHLGVGHLLTNLAGYAMVVPIVYLLSAFAGKRQWFYVVTVTFLFALPVALSFLNLAVSRPGVAVGFSGINMAFVGYLPLALAGYLHVNFDIDATLDLAGGLFFVGLAIVGLLSVQSPLTLVATAAALGSAALYWLSFAGGDLEMQFDARAAANTPGYLELAGVAVVLFVGLTVVAFPLDPISEASVVNVYVHLLGYAIGFIATYISVDMIHNLSAGQFWPDEAPGAGPADDSESAPTTAPAATAQRAARRNETSSTDGGFQF